MNEKMKYRRLERRGHNENRVAARKKNRIVFVSSRGYEYQTNTISKS